MTRSELPIDDVLPRIRTALAARPNLVLSAPPGAGKTTGAPLALIGEPWVQDRRLLMLEPRRIAARAAAERMSEVLGTPVGERVGYRIRGEARVSATTRIEVVTEGILTRMLQADPELTGIAAILFDEIHERSIHSDLGLALALDVQGALRPDLRLIAMSATLDTERLAAYLPEATRVESAGRAFPVETRWLDAPWKSGRGRETRLEDAAAALIRQALSETEGSILVFLPGAGEINRVTSRLGHLGDTQVLPLHGALPFAEQRKALRADPAGARRVILATAIAETSLTVEDVRVVVDCGLARRARFHPGRGMSRLVTEPVSRAEAEQRRGRAGRIAPGICYRMWTRGGEGALPAAAPPEILEADLTPLALDLAAWGVTDPSDLNFLDPPPEAGLTEARALLGQLGALDASDAITPLGRQMAELPSHPRLAHMILIAQEEGLGAEAALLAALLSGRDPFRRAGGVTSRALSARAEAVLGRGHDALDPAAAHQILSEAKRFGLGRADPAKLRAAAGWLLALAYPDRVAQRRPGDEARYLLANGRGAALAGDETLAAAALIVVADLEDKGRDAQIRLAEPLAKADLRRLRATAIEIRREARWSARENRVIAREIEAYGAIALSQKRWRDAPPEALGAALAEGLRQKGLSAIDWPRRASALRGRVMWLRAHGGDSLADLSDAGLTESLDNWLTPHLSGLTRIEQIAGLDLTELLRAHIGWEAMAALDRAAPEHFETPLGSKLAIDYARAAPTVSVKVQELFGLTRHPSVGEPPVALVLELLSPAGRPVQTTQDLPGFWASSYADVRKDMRARYPKHPWPDDPANAQPTRRAKPKPRA